MSFIEFIGFIIALVALAVLSARKAQEERRRRMHPEEFQHEKEEEERAYRELLRNLDLPIPKELEADTPPTPTRVVASAPTAAPAWKAPVTKRLVRSDFKFSSRIDSRRQPTRIENRRLNDAIAERQARFKRKVGSEAMQTEHPSTDAYNIVEQVMSDPRGHQMLQKLDNPLQIVLFHEILSKPKAFRSAWDR